MPLRDHFRMPVWKQVSWEGFHAGWPMVIVQHLAKHLPEHYTAEPRVHLGSAYEIDVCAFDEGELSPSSTRRAKDGALATATWSAPEPTTVAEVEAVDDYEYEVLVFDDSRDRRLVAAVELVSPANKDRPESRRTFVAKCSTLLQKKVSVSIVDLVTTRHFNLYGELLELIGHAEQDFTITSPSTYAVTFRGLKQSNGRPRLESWAYPMEVGKPLPTLPIWLTEDDCVPLELEASYEETCKVFRIV